MFRLILTAVLVPFNIIIIKVYDSGGSVDYDNKIFFNTVTTVLSFALGSNSYVRP